MNCRRCGTPAPAFELVDKDEGDGRGLCLTCLAQQRDLYRDLYRAATGTGNNSKEICLLGRQNGLGSPQ